MDDINDSRRRSLGTLRKNSTLSPVSFSVSSLLLLSLRSPPLLLWFRCWLLPLLLLLLLLLLMLLIMPRSADEVEECWRGNRSTALKVGIPRIGSRDEDFCSRGSVRLRSRSISSMLLDALLLWWLLLDDDDCDAAIAANDTSSTICFSLLAMRSSKYNEELFLSLLLLLLLWSFRGTIMCGCLSCCCRCRRRCCINCECSD